MESPIVMQDVYQESIRLLQQNEPCILATVVSTRGMTPQKAGARQLFRQDGSCVGTLGGGCVEGDIWYYAKQMLQNNSEPEFREYNLNADLAANDGLVCGGTMQFFLQPLARTEELLPFFLEILQAYEKDPAIAVATIVKSSNSNLPSGKHLLVREDGSSFGETGSRQLDERIVDEAKKFVKYGGCTLINYDDLTIFVQGFTTIPTLVILGAGHVGLAIYNLAMLLGFRVVMVDDREDFANPVRFPGAAQTVVNSFENVLADVEINRNTFIIIATRGHRYDDLAARAAVATRARYIGLLGSKRKNLLIFRQLHQSGVPVSRLQEIHAPVGLNIGALTPEELAVSILAEIIQCIRGGAGGAMKMPETELAKLLAK